MRPSLRLPRSLVRLTPWLLLGGSCLVTACGTTPPADGSGGTAAGGVPGSGGAPSSGGTASGGTPDGGGGTPSTGGTPATGGTAAGGTSAGGSDPGTGGDGSGGSAPQGFACPAGSESMTPTLTGTPTALPGTVPAAPGSGSNSIVEGPVWIDGTLYLSQIRDYGPLNPAQLLKHNGTDYTVWMPDSGTNGLAVTADGKILAASHGVGGLVEIDPAAASPAATTIIAEFMGERLNSPNDLVIRSDGTVYFTDPDYQCNTQCDQAAKRVYRYPAAGGALEEIPTSSSNTNPNGITLSLDETKLYVAGPAGIDIYTLDAGGAVTDGPDPFASGGPVDGLARDCAGNIYAAINNGITVLDTEGAQVGSPITVPNATTNVAFGGTSGTVLYITTRANAGVYSLDVGIPGYPY